MLVNVMLERHSTTWLSVSIATSLPPDSKAYARAAVAMVTGALQQPLRLALHATAPLPRSTAQACCRNCASSAMPAKARFWCMLACRMVALAGCTPQQTSGGS